MFCMNCGTQMPDTAKFCPKCGTRTDAAPAPEQKAEAPASAPQKAFTAPVQSAAPVAAAAAATATAAAAATATAAAKTVSKGKRLVALALVLVLAAALFTAYVSAKIESPDEVTDRFFRCYAKADINGMMDCVEPKVGSQLNAALGIGSSLLDIAGFGVDLSDVIGLAPIFSDYLDIDDYNPGNYEVVKYKGGALVETLGGVWEAVGVAFGEEAIVEFDMDNIRGGPVTGIKSDASRVRVRIKVINCGDDGWRLPEDMKPEYIRDVY